MSSLLLLLFEVNAASARPRPRNEEVGCCLKVMGDGLNLKTLNKQKGSKYSGDPNNGPLNNRNI